MMMCFGCAHSREGSKAGSLCQQQRLCQAGFIDRRWFRRSMRMRDADPLCHPGGGALWRPTLAQTRGHR